MEPKMSNLDNLLSEGTEQPVEPQDTEVKEAEPAIEAEPVQEEPVIEEPTQVEEPQEEVKQENVPLATFLDQRDELKQLKQKLASLEEKPQEQPQAPDVFEDPEGYTNYIERQNQAQVRNMEIAMSERFAKMAYKGEWSEVEQYAESKFNPQSPDYDYGLHLQMQRSNNPWQDVVQAYERNKVLTTVGDDIEGYREKLKQEILAEMNAGQVTEEQPAQAEVKLPSDFSKGQGGGIKQNSFVPSELGELLK